MTKVALRQQATEYDCVPTSLINALCYLFRRAELPPFVVQRVYKDCLDHLAGRGTSSQAIHDIGHWLNCYKEKRFARFAVATSYIYCEDVHLQCSSRIIKCLDTGGAVLIFVHSSQYERHCILGIRYADGWLYCYEPHPRSKRFITNEAVQFIEPTGIHAPNIKIRCDWLERTSDQANHSSEWKYVFGNISNRECLLMQRIRE